MRRRSFLLVVAEHSVLIGAALLFLLPFVFIALTSLMTNDQALTTRLWPEPFHWRNYYDIFDQAPLLRWLGNTRGLHGARDARPAALEHPRRLRLLAPAVEGPRRRLPGRAGGADAAAADPVIPLYVMWAKLHLIGSLWPLIVPNWFGDAFTIFLLRQFFMTIPQDYLDAARVDGAGEFRILVSIVLRLAKPAIVAVALFSASTCFNDYFLPLLYTGENAGRLGGVGRAVALPLAAPGAVEPDDGRHGPGHDAGDARVLPRPEGVRRGRDADGGEVMKRRRHRRRVDVHAGAGLGLARERERLGVEGLALHDIDAERRDVVGGLAAADTRRRRATAAARADRRPRRARSTAPTSCWCSCASAARRRASPTRRCRSRAAASGRRRPAPAASPRRCGPCPWCWTSPSGCASAPRGAWIVDFTNPVGIVTRALLDAGHRAIGLCNVAIGFQRHFARLLGVAPSGCPSTRSGSTT